MKEKKYRCPVCGSVFIKCVYKKVQAIYCSQKCAYRGRSLGFTKRIIREPYNCRRRKPRICLTCGKEYIYKKSTQKYCSRKCFEISHKERMRGEGNPSFIDGASYQKRGWRGHDWETLRLEIYRRDNYTCQDCGVKCIARKYMNRQNTAKIIQCHHIEGKDNRKINLITLCMSCHIKRHNYYKGVRGK